MSYNPEKARLRIRFLSGNVYEYKKVPPPVYRAISKASSKGTYLNRHIKGNYAYKKVK